MNNDAIIGHTGFVGSNLATQHDFGARYRSTDIESISGQSYDLVVCAGARAEKWKANADPVGDRMGTEHLIRALGTAKASRVVLISTVDVFAKPSGIDEETIPLAEGLHAYGANRLFLEHAVAARFETVILRLPGLFGNGLKKNIIYDFLHDNNVKKIDSRAVFQFYNLDRLWSDIRIALALGKPIVHLATEPVSVTDVARQSFHTDFDNPLEAMPARYDMRTRYAARFGGAGSYIESSDEVLSGIATFVARYRAGREDQ